MGRLLQSEEQTPDPRLERLAHGTLEDDARAALEVEAENDAELARDVALHKPLSDALQDRLLSIAEDGLAGPSGAGVAEAPVVERVPPKRATPPKVSRRWAYGAGLALAAGLSLVVISPEIFRAPPAPLPAYTFSARAGDAALRGETPAPEAARRMLREDSEVSLIMRADGETRDEIRARLFALDASGAHEVALTPVRRNAAFLFRGTAEALSGGRRGHVDLVMRVERPGLRLAPPTDAAPRSGPGWTSTGVHLEILARP